MSYKEELDHLFQAALKIQQEKHADRLESHSKVAAIVAVTSLRDRLEKLHGKGNAPMSALLAMRDLMAETSSLTTK